MGKLIVALLLAALLVPAARADRDEHERARELRDAGTILPLEQIIGHARKHAQGRLIEVELKQKGGRYLYEVEMLNEQGELWEVLLDAASGELVEIKREE